jgi:uncharacterized protein YjbI with pentapeptide repeats
MANLNLPSILADHRKWRSGQGGQRADLSGVNLRGANLREADLSDADLHGADLRWADLRGANLRGANLRGADLGWAILHKADLRGANLRGADLRWAYLPLGVLTAQLGPWAVYVTATHTAIGCEFRKNAEWLSMDPRAIADLDESAADWVARYGGIARMMIETAQLEGGSNG